MTIWIQKITLILAGVIFILGAGSNISLAEDTDNIRDLLSYAEQFDPCTTDDIRGKWGSCKNLYNTPNNIENILTRHEMTDDYMAAVMLVLLKHYNYEFSSFHQGYEIRRGIFKKESPFVKAFMRITGRGGGDYMTAGVAYSWVREHPGFFQYKSIAAEMKKIDDAAKEFEEMFNEGLKSPPASNARRKSTQH